MRKYFFDNSIKVVQCFYQLHFLIKEDLLLDHFQLDNYHKKIIRWMIQSHNFLIKFFISEYIHNNNIKKQAIERILYINSYF